MSSSLDTHEDSVRRETEDLVRRVREGDAEAFDPLVRQHEARVFNLAYRMLNNYEEANDLTQDVFIQVFRKIRGFRGESRFDTWVYAIALNMCRNRFRRLRRIRFFEAESLDEPRGGEDDLPPPEPAAPTASPREAVALNDARRLG